jgi:hypothetical protein
VENGAMPTGGRGSGDPLGNTVNDNRVSQEGVCRGIDHEDLLRNVHRRVGTCAVRSNSHPARGIERREGDPSLDCSVRLMSLT